MENKGEVTTKQLVTIIILIVSFTVILFLIFRLNLGETTNKEICHNSVVLASKSKGFSGPLDCRTTYLCVSGSGECEDITPDVTEEINVEEGNKEKVMEIMADEMADCWWMFGEGKIDYVGGIKGKTACGVCSAIEFDENVQETYEEISYKEFINYLANSQVSNDNRKTYLNYLYGTADLNKVLENEIIKDYYDNRKISLGERLVIITGESKTKGIVYGINRIAGIEERTFIAPVILGSDRVSEELSVCDEFVTKS